MNNNSVCDSDEPSLTTASNAQGIVLDNESLNNVSDTTAQNIAQLNSSAKITSSGNQTQSLSVTEQYEKDFLALNRSYFYSVYTEGYGYLWVVTSLDKIKYTSPDHLFEVRNGTVIPSAWRIQAYDDLFIYHVQRRELPVLDYIAYENGSFYGCYVRAGTYARENCIEDNTTESKPIIYENISFTPPETPIDWLEKFDGKTPLKIKYDYTNKEDDLVRMVDLLYFQNDDVLPE